MKKKLHLLIKRNCNVLKDFMIGSNILKLKPIIKCTKLSDYNHSLNNHIIKGCIYN